MKKIIFKQKSSAVFLRLAGLKQYRLAALLIVLVLAVIFLYFYNDFQNKNGQGQSALEAGSEALAEGVVEDDNTITKLQKETVSENVTVLDKSVDALEDRYRHAVLDVWISYQVSPDNFFHIRDVVQVLHQVNVPFLYQNFHTRLIDSLQMKEKALISGDLVNLQKAEREINFLENTSFL
jgi:hypothetical protein